MNFLRTMSLQRIADILKIQLNGEQLKTQSTLNLTSPNITFSQVEGKDETTLELRAGGTGKLGYWGGFFDTSDQTITSTSTAYVIQLNSANPDNDGVSLSGNKIVPTTPGVYNIATSIQVTNSQSQAHDASFWFRKNGTDIDNSCSVITVPSTHGGVNGHIIFYVDLIMKLNAGDYVELIWSAANTGVYLETIAAGVSPASPASPSVIVSVVQV